MDPRARPGDPRLQGNRRASPSPGDPRKRSVSRGPGDDARKRQRDSSSHPSTARPRHTPFQAFNAWGGVHGPETGTVQNGPFSYGPEMHEKNKDVEIRKRFDYSRTNSLSHWVTPKDLQIYRYRNYLVPTLPRTRPINEASSMR